MKLLDEREISQKEFASTLNIAPTTLNGYIKNKRQPDLELVKRIALLLNVSTDFLLDHSSNGVQLSVKELSLLLRFRELDDTQQEMICDLVNITAKKMKKAKK